jgi:hypothetical protein
VEQENNLILQEQLHTMPEVEEVEQKLVALQPEALVVVVMEQ